MTPSVLFAERQESIQDAYERLCQGRVQQLPVLDGGELVGIVSAADLALVQHLPPQATASIPVGAIMDPKIYAVSPDAAVDAVAREMARNKYHAALVVAGGKARGVFTTTDALRALSDSLTDSLDAERED
jgi:CBS domain-containing protein